VIDPLVILKAPGDCSDQELERYEELVRQGDEVVSHGLSERIRQAAVLTFAFHGDRLVAVAALKRPTDSYRVGVFRKAGEALPELGALELGWIFVLPDCRGRGLAGRVLAATLDASGGAGVFATTRSDNGPMQKVLEGRRFVRLGQGYKSTRGGYELNLFFRSALAPSTPP
jgi:GNAT superfamily N-acetyltransferase